MSQNSPDQVINLPEGGGDDWDDLAVIADPADPGKNFHNDSHTGISMLDSVTVTGHDQSKADPTNPSKQFKELPPLTFGYTTFDPYDRDIFPLEGELPTRSLASPDLELADRFGNGLPDIIQINDTVRYWRNRDDGRFDLPRPMRYAPAGLQLADPNIQLLDVNGDGRIDILTTSCLRLNTLCMNVASGDGFFGKYWFVSVVRRFRDESDGMEIHGRGRVRCIDNGIVSKPK